MKNLLLLFLVSFTLFWVGCEKEEIQIQPEKTVKSEADDTALSRSASDECCDAGFVGFNYGPANVSGGFNVYVQFNDIKLASESAGSSFARLRIFINEDFMNPYFNQLVFDVPACGGVESFTEAISIDEIQGCPYKVTARVEVFTIDDLGNSSLCDILQSGYVYPDAPYCPNDFPGGKTR